MSEIPDDLRRTAEEFASEYADHYLEREAAAAYTRAILAERERCAAVVEGLASVGFALPGEEGFARLAAGVIRKGEA
jgi:hypothetical protein